MSTGKKKSNPALNPTKARAKSAAKAPPASDRPFSAAILGKARKAIAEYEVILSCEEDGTWFGRGLELSGAMGDGATADACVAETREAMVSVAATMLENGEPLPLPAKMERRSEQINLRLTPHERTRVESLSISGGYASVSDFVRIRALAVG